MQFIHSQLITETISIFQILNMFLLQCLAEVLCAHPISLHKAFKNRYIWLRFPKVIYNVTLNTFSCDFFSPHLGVSENGLATIVFKGNNLASYMYLPKTSEYNDKHN